MNIPATANRIDWQVSYAKSLLAPPIRSKQSHKWSVYARCIYSHVQKNAVAFNSFSCQQLNIIRLNDERWNDACALAYRMWLRFFIQNWEREREYWSNFVWRKFSRISLIEFFTHAREDLAMYRLRSRTVFCIHTPNSRVSHVRLIMLTKDWLLNIYHFEYSNDQTKYCARLILALNSFARNTFGSKIAAIGFCSSNIFEIRSFKCHKYMFNENTGNIFHDS